MLKPKKLKKSAVNTTARRQDKNRYVDDQPGSKTDNLVIQSTDRSSIHKKNETEQIELDKISAYKQV